MTITRTQLIDLLRRPGTETPVEVLRAALDHAEDKAEAATLAMTRATKSQTEAHGYQRLAHAICYRLAEATQARYVAPLWAEALGCELDELHDHAGAARAFQVASGLEPDPRHRAAAGMRAMEAAAAAVVCPHRVQPLPPASPSASPPAAAAAPLSAFSASPLIDALKQAIGRGVAMLATHKSGMAHVARWIDDVMWDGPYVLRGDIPEAWL